MHHAVTKRMQPYVLLIPALIIYTFIMIIPMFDNLRISFTDWDGIGKSSSFIGLSNYILILQDARLYKAIWVTFKISFFIIIFQQTLGLILALILEKSTRTNTFFRSLFFIPNLLNTVSIGLVFSYALSLNFGFVSPFFKMVGLTGLASVDWLGDPSYASWSVVFTTVWQYSGLSMVLYIGSLVEIPGEFYESASIDGAGVWVRFKNITFPLIAPALTLNTLITLIGCLKLFDIPFILTGGQSEATQTMAILLYNDAFISRTAGRGAADAMILLVIVVLLSLLQNSYLKSREVNM